VYRAICDTLLPKLSRGSASTPASTSNENAAQEVQKDLRSWEARDATRFLGAGATLN